MQKNSESLHTVLIFKLAYLPGLPNYPGGSRILMVLYDCTTETEISRKHARVRPNPSPRLATLCRSVAGQAQN